MPYLIRIYCVRRFRSRCATAENNSDSFFALFNLGTTSIFVIIVTKKTLRLGTEVGWQLSTVGENAGVRENEEERKKEGKREHDEDDRVKGERCILTRGVPRNLR